jgi:glycosyltransferase involved in cell wall biosynthesis
MWYGNLKRKLIFELNEKPGTVYTGRFQELPPIKWAGLFLNRLSMKVFDGFIVISEPLRDYISKRKRRSASIIKLPIVIDATESFCEDGIEIPEHPYFIHTGAFSQQKDGIVDIFRAFALVVERTGKDLHFYVTGTKDAPSKVMNEINKIMDVGDLKERVHFLGYIDEDTLRTLQKHCIFLVLPKPDNEQNRHNFATKLGEYLALSKPVITTAVGDMALYMRNERTALLVEPGNIEQIADAMIRIMEEKGLAQKLGDAGRELAETVFDYKILGRQLADYLFQFHHSKR